MPIYEYLCDCGHLFEILTTIHKHKNRKKCEQCGKMAVQTIHPAVGRFKNEEYGHFEPSFDRPYARVDANPWTDDTSK